MPTGKSKEETLQDQITLLEDLHRPLEGFENSYLCQTACQVL
jgi:hypothetical protein